MNEPYDPSDRTVSFDVLVRGDAPDDAVATVHNIDEFRPSGEALEQVRRWLAEQGCAVAVTEFGVSGSLPESSLSDVFGVDAAHPETRMLPVPSEISGLVSMITVSQRPDFF